MKRSGILITLLLSLFMFQSLWNVAAAFCVHENTTASSGLSHFGHHVTLHCSNDQFENKWSDHAESAFGQHAFHQQNSHFQDIKAIQDNSHLQALSEHPSQQDKPENNLQFQNFINFLEDDHSDHLPSFAYFIVKDVQKQALQPKLTADPESAYSDWNNLYQSPHLYLPNPPPASSPL